MRILCLQHTESEGPGILPEYAEQHNYSFTLLNARTAKTLPKLTEFDLLILLGSPESVKEVDSNASMKQEFDFVQSCLEANKKIIGICFGAQLLATLLGAEVHTIRSTEIGWFPIKFEKDFYKIVDIPVGKQHMNVLHWHGEGFTLPEGAHLLAHNTLTRNQWFLHGSNVMGIQFHLESTIDSVTTMIDAFKESFLPENRTEFVQTPDKILTQSRLFSYSNRFLYLILDWFIQEN